MEITNENLIDVNGGSWDGWGAIFTGAAMALTATITLCTAPVSAGVGAACAVGYLAGKAGVAFGIASVISGEW